MNPTNKLALRDIHLPDPVSWWPPAPGWWFLLLFSVLLLWVMVWWIKKRLKPVLKKSARKEIESAITDYRQHQQKHKFIQQLSVSLRRIGISYLPRNQVAGIAGSDWYEKINQLVATKPFSDDSIKILSEAAYQRNPELDDKTISTLIMQTQQWVSALSSENRNA